MQKRILHLWFREFMGAVMPVITCSFYLPNLLLLLVGTSSPNKTFGVVFDSLPDIKPAVKGMLKTDVKQGESPISLKAFLIHELLRDGVR